MNLFIWGGAFLFVAGIPLSPWLMFAGTALFATGALMLLAEIIAG